MTVGDIESQNYKIWSSTGVLGSIKECSNNKQPILNTIKRNFNHINSVADAGFSNDDSEKKTNNDHHQTRFQKYSKAKNTNLMKDAHSYNNSKTNFLNKIENIDYEGNEETPSLSALLTDNEYSPIKLVDPIINTYRTSEIIDFDNKELENFKKIKYTISDLVKLEPTSLYQIGDSINYNGDLLITDIIFGETAPGQNFEILQLEDEYTKMGFDLISPSLDFASKQVQLIRFIASSVVLQKQNNPRIFLHSYGILIEQLMECYLVPRTKDQISVFVLNALIEVLMKYFLICWKFEYLEHKCMDKQFKEWKIQPFVLDKAKIYKFSVALLLTGYKTNLLGEFLVFFSTSPTPHLFHVILTEAAATYALPVATKRLIQYLQRQLLFEHLRCCGGSNEEKYSELSSTSAPSIYVCKSDQTMGVPNTEVIIDEKSIVQENSTFHKSVTEPECDRFPGSLNDYFKF